MCATTSPVPRRAVRHHASPPSRHHTRMSRRARAPRSVCRTPRDVLSCHVELPHAPSRSSCRLPTGPPRSPYACAPTEARPSYPQLNGWGRLSHEACVPHSPLKGFSPFPRACAPPPSSRARHRQDTIRASPLTLSSALCRCRPAPPAPPLGPPGATSATPCRPHLTLAGVS
jgi:hypothetical protein